MQMLVKPATIVRPRLFGRGRSFVLAAPAVSSSMAKDLRLFGITFAGGFLFMTVFLA